MPLVLSEELDWCQSRLRRAREVSTLPLKCSLEAANRLISFSLKGVYGGMTLFCEFDRKKGKRGTFSGAILLDLKAPASLEGEPVLFGVGVSGYKVKGKANLFEHVQDIYARTAKKAVDAASSPLYRCVLEHYLEVLRSYLRSREVREVLHQRLRAWGAFPEQDAYTIEDWVKSMYLCECDNGAYIVDAFGAWNFQPVRSNWHWKSYTTMECVESPGV